MKCILQPPKLQRNDIGRTKKIGCTARIVLDERIYFPKDKAVPAPGQKIESLMRTISWQLKQKFASLSDKSDNFGEKRICLTFNTDHNHERCQQEDSDLIPER